jgi:2-polyprenyl-3-methyl-5-hydroxy-6-metoxy-1,4-benzoquinol methylase
MASSSNTCCRFCNAPLTHVVADLGMSPMANAYRKQDELGRMERFYPLRAYVCGTCLLVQLEEFESPEEIFSEYAYFSSYSKSWLEHAKSYADAMSSRFGLGPQSKVVEIACNDGYLLRWFKERGVGVFGVEPAANVAESAKALGIDVSTRFFGRQTAMDLAAAGQRADLMTANNVVAHVPDLNDFIAGFKVLLKPEGVVTFEFHHVLNLLERNQFDTIYHEHFCYHSLTTFIRMLAHHGLQVFDVETLSTHGGSLRVYAQHDDTGVQSKSPNVDMMVSMERQHGLTEIGTYLDFNKRCIQMKHRFLQFLIEAKAAGKSIVGYGAPAKGNTLLNYAGVRTDFIDYTVDLNPVKQGRYLPGTCIPIRHPDAILSTRPDYVLILPWNLREEISTQMSAIGDWGGKFLVLIPEVEVVEPVKAVRREAASEVSG